MDSNTYSAQQPEELAALAAAVDGLAAQDLDRLCDAALASQVLALRGLVDRLEGHWLQQLAAVDGRGGADQDQPAPSTASWLQSRLRLGAGAAASSVRTARALLRGSLAGTAEALVGGAISPAHARVLADGTHDLPPHITAAPTSVSATDRRSRTHTRWRESNTSWRRRRPGCPRPWAAPPPSRWRSGGPAGSSSGPAHRPGRA